jgi:penicillin-binding protein activator
MKTLAFFAMISLLLLTLVGCAPTTQVTRMGVDQDVDLSGRWNDVDSRQVSEQMVQSITNGGWISEFSNEAGRKPAVIVGTVRNLSSEHIATGAFCKDIEKALTNNGRVKVVASSAERQEVRDERGDQQINASEESAKRLAQEQGADFMLKGEINTIVDRIEGKQVKYYQINLELVNVETNEKVWMDDKKIKKEVRQSKTGF